MSRLFVAVACLGLCALAANANTIRFYFSTTNSVAAVQPEYSASEVPVASPGDTLYLRAFIETGKRIPCEAESALHVDTPLLPIRAI